MGLYQNDIIGIFMNINRNDENLDFRRENLLPFEGVNIGPIEQSIIVYITDRSKAMLLWWFYLFYVFMSNFVLLAPHVRFNIFS